MRTLALVSIAALAASGCASTESMRQAQMARPAPKASALFPIENELRDSVIIDWIGGVSQHSYVLAEPNGKRLRAALRSALNDSGLLAQTPVRVRYGLRVLVEDADGPTLGGTARSHLRATYILVDKSDGQEIFRETVDSTGSSMFLGLEHLSAVG